MHAIGHLDYGIIVNINNTEVCVGIHKPLISFLMRIHFQRKNQWVKGVNVFRLIMFSHSVIFFIQQLIIEQFPHAKTLF